MLFLLIWKEDIVVKHNYFIVFLDMEDFIMFSRGNTILAQPFNNTEEHFDSFAPLLINQTGYTMFDYDSRDGYIYWIAVCYFYCLL